LGSLGILMDLDDQLSLNHLFLNDRKCRTCGEIKNLIDGFYKLRKNKGQNASSYSYECKVCSIRRAVKDRKDRRIFSDWNYPDW